MRKARGSIETDAPESIIIHSGSDKIKDSHKNVENVSSSIALRSSSKLDPMLEDGAGAAPTHHQDQAIYPKKPSSRSPMRIPTLAMIERRISTDFLDIAGRLEGLKPLPQLVKDLNRETSNYRNLAVGLGGSSDCEQLREELRKSRQHATDLARQAKAKILPCLQDPNKCSSAERKEAKRLCKLLFFCIKVLESSCKCLMSR